MREKRENMYYGKCVRLQYIDGDDIHKLTDTLFIYREVYAGSVMMGVLITCGH